MLVLSFAYCIEQRKEHFSSNSNAIELLDWDVGFTRNNKKLKGMRWQDSLMRIQKNTPTEFLSFMKFRYKFSWTLRIA